MVVAFDHANKSARLSLRQTEILDKLRGIVDDLSEASDDQLSCDPEQVSSFRI